MPTVFEMSREELEALYGSASARYEECKAMGLKLDMSRGKPGLEQLALSDDMLNMFIDPSETKMDGVEARNYGELMGLPACRRAAAVVSG